MLTGTRKPIIPTVFSLALLVFSAAWFGAWALASATESRATDGWSDTPFALMAAMYLIPVFCAGSGALLLWSRHEHGERLTLLDKSALVLGLIVVGLAALALAMLIGSLHAMGIKLLGG